MLQYKLGKGSCSRERDGRTDASLGKSVWQAANQKEAIGKMEQDS